MLEARAVDINANTTYVKHNITKNIFLFFLFILQRALDGWPLKIHKLVAFGPSPRLLCVCVGGGGGGGRKLNKLLQAQLV